MASKSALLRNIRPSEGLFTENILLRLRDNPNQLKIGKIESFLEEDTKEERKKLTDKKLIIFDWCIQKWDEISPNIEEWSIEDLAKKKIGLVKPIKPYIENLEKYKNKEINRLRENIIGLFVKEEKKKKLADQRKIMRQTEKEFLTGKINGEEYAKARKKYLLLKD